MKQQQRIGQTQQLALTPQLRQSLHMLQLSAVELEAEVASAIEENPLLDWLENDGIAPAEDSTPHDEAHRPSDTEPTEPAEASAPADDFGDTADDFDWSTPGAAGSGDEDGETFAERQAIPETLQDHLRWQLNMSGLDETATAVALALIDSLDDAGYLPEAPEAIAESLRPEVDADTAAIRQATAWLHRCDPLGVGARSLAECLQLQLAPRTDLSPELRGRAMQACGSLERLPKLGPDGLARELGCGCAQANEVLALLRSLDPRPGSSYAPVQSDAYVVPDASIFRQGGIWRATLSAQALPRVGLHQHYMRMAADATQRDAGYLRGQLQQAQWLLKAIRARGDTLLAVVRCLAREQSGFLEFGPQALRPLTLRDVAGMLGMHESTISRAVARKYVHTPRGTLPLRAFFSNAMDTELGATSSTAVQDRLRELIAAEDPRKPLSDAALTATLNAAGVQVARRTVAKYREQLGILPSHERVRLG